MPRRGLSGRGLPGRGLPGRGPPGHGLPGRGLPGPGIPKRGVAFLAYRKKLIFRQSVYKLKCFLVLASEYIPICIK